MPIDTLFGSAGVQPVRRPTVAVAFGEAGGGPAGAASALGFGGSGDAWARALVRFTVESVLAPDVGFAEVVYAPTHGEPAAAVGDAGTIEVGYADTAATRLFTGAVRTVVRDGHGLARLVAVDGAAMLAGLRVDTSFEGRSAGDHVRALAGEAGVATGTVASGIDLPFLAVDAGRSAWSHIAMLARLSGHWSYVAPDGRLYFVPVEAGEPAARFTFGEDILAIRRTAAAAPFGAVTTRGEGAAGSQGGDAWAMLVKDPSPVTGTAGRGSPARRFAAGALRTGDAARAAAAGIAAAAARLSDHGELLVPGAPDVTAGATIAVDAADAGYAGTFLVTAVRHTYDKRHGYRSRIRFTGGGGGGGGGGLTVGL
jgi:hypothetical protein